jgi:hypothetical protein
VQGDAGHPEKNNLKKWRAEEEERHKGSLSQKKKKGFMESRCDSAEK